MYAGTACLHAVARRQLVCVYLDTRGSPEVSLRRRAAARWITEKKHETHRRLGFRFLYFVL